MDSNRVAGSSQTLGHGTQDGPGSLTGNGIRQENSQPKNGIVRLLDLVRRRPPLSAGAAIVAAGLPIRQGWLMPARLPQVVPGILAGALVLCGSAGMAAAQPGTGAARPPVSSPSRPVQGGPDRPLASQQFMREQDARTHCPGAVVVWVNTSSRAYHLAGTTFYGRTKHGAFMCQADADRDAFHVVKGEMPAKPGR